MDDVTFGRLVRLARIERRWRQVDVALRAAVSVTSVSRLERGHAGKLPLETIRAIAAVVEITVHLQAKARAVNLDRVVNRRHSSLADYVAAWIGSMPDWVVRAEVSYSEFGERGSIDLLCWHQASRSLLVIEIKTELLEFGSLLAKLDEKGRLAPKIALRFGWRPASVSTCLLVADSTTNRRRAAAHAALLRSKLPHDARTIVRFLKLPSAAPVRPVAGIRFVSDPRRGHVRTEFASPTRVRTRRPR
jgi:transcriptional regulator with XRE-family HTH domain